MLTRRLQRQVAAALAQSPAVVLLGPRQVGKTTLALEVARSIGGTYLDLESERDRAKLSQPELYLDDHQGAEIDLLLLWPDGKSWAVEIKRSLTPSVQRGFHSACTDVRPTRKLVVYPGRDAFRIADDIEAVPLEALARELAG